MSDYSCLLTCSYFSRDKVIDPLDELLYVSTLEDKYLPTVGISHSFATVVQDVAPFIRHIIRHEHERKGIKPDQMSLESLWSNTRKTRRQVKQEQEGRKSWFADKQLDHDAVLKTWLDISCTQRDGNIGDLDMEK
jgi:hypothetical protein